MIDIHAHILPCIDDGARSEKESLALLEKAKKMGVIKDGSDKAKEFLEIADLVIICIYPRLIKGFMMENRNLKIIEKYVII